MESYAPNRPGPPVRPRIDLSSDTQTRPSRAMREAIAAAEVGDEQKGEDPTVNRLQDMVAELTGKEAGLLVPSGTMANQICYRIWGRPGEEILLDRSAHAIHYECGATAALSGLQLLPLDGVLGRFTAADVEAALRARGVRHHPRQCCVSVEQTTNRGGGGVWQLEALEDIATVARRAGLAMHMDGARLLNAVVASGIPATRFAALFDSVWIDLSKGLGCPIGAVIAGDRAMIEEAVHYKQQFGGSMRQAGIIAAAGVYALEHNVERLAEDHANAHTLATGLAALPGVSLAPPTVETNIVIFDVSGTGLSADTFAQELMTRSGVRMGAIAPTLIRAVTHLDVSASDVGEAIAAVGALLADRPDARHSPHSKTSRPEDLTP